MALITRIIFQMKCSSSRKHVVVNEFQFFCFFSAASATKWPKRDFSKWNDTSINHKVIRSNSKFAVFWSFFMKKREQVDVRFA